MTKGKVYLKKNDNSNRMIYPDDFDLEGAAQNADSVRDSQVLSSEIPNQPDPSQTSRRAPFHANQPPSPSVLTPMIFSQSNKYSSNSSVTFVSKNLNTQLKQLDNFNLNICHLNAQSLCSSTHHEELRQFVSSKNLDIIAISETWLKDYIPDNGSIHVHHR